MNNQIKPELLSPAGDYESLYAAINAGCDAVYFGIKGLFNLRDGAKNFELKDISKVVGIAHKNNIKAYLTLNTIIYDKDISRLNKILDAAKKAKVNAIICWDPAVLGAAKKRGIESHISTQASVSNINAVKHYAKLGATRIVLARELSLDQVKKIKKYIKKEKLNIEIELFVHGAMCVSVSGRCFISQFNHCKSANRGLCLQPCRRKYQIYLIKDSEEGHEMILGEDYVMSAKDLCTMPFIDEIINIADSLKIEGRNRSPEYVAVTTECYRKAIEAYNNGKLTPLLKKELFERLNRVYNRGFSSGFYLGKPLNEWVKNYGSVATEKKEYIGRITNYFKKVGVAEIKMHTGKLSIGDEIYIQGPTTGVVNIKVSSIELDDKKINFASKGKKICIKTEFIVRKNDKVYRIINKIIKNEVMSKAF